MATTPATRRGLLAALAIAALALALALTGAPSTGVATATVPPKKCGKIKAKGDRFAVKAHRTKCRFAKKSSKNVLKGKGSPKGWSCQRYPKKQTRIAFVCRKSGKDFFAIRK